MLNRPLTILVLMVAILALAGFDARRPSNASSPAYSIDGRLLFPAQYREWPFLTAGFDMSYSADPAMAGHHMFDNVFVSPDAYAAFVRTGSWPNGTMLVLEHRQAQGKGSINQRGSFQTGVMDIEVHVKDAVRFPIKWGFFAFDAGEQTSTLIPRAAACYSCHAAHGAVDTTFVQFYPTLLPLAQRGASARVDRSRYGLNVVETAKRATERQSRAESRSGRRRTREHRG